MDRPDRIAPGPGQESVWDYPRPPRVERSAAHVVVRHGGVTLVDTTRAVRVLETSQAPAFYFPPADVALEHLRRNDTTSFCEWKGLAVYWDVVVGDRVAPRAGWSYPDPSAAYAEIRDHLAFYPQRVEECSVDGELVSANGGDFYGGWITSRVVGPFKGAPGTLGW